MNCADCVFYLPTCLCMNPESPKYHNHYTYKRIRPDDGCDEGEESNG